MTAPSVPSSHLLTFKAFILAFLFCYTVILASAQDDDDDEPTSSAAQRSAPFVDQATGLPMERFFGARTQFGFAMALPEEPSPSSFIGQLSFPLVDGAGWGAMGLTGDMEGNFFLAAWPDGRGGVMATFRQATDEENPPEVTGRFAVRPIADGVSVNATSLTYTFLCENCLDATLGLGPEAAGAGADAVMGWALSERAVRNPGDPGANLGFHERGFGPFTARLGSARSAGFGAVAATAGAPVGSSNRAVAVTPNAFRGEGEGEGDEGGGGGGGGRRGDDDDD
ncbi:Cellobiose dehydrogenase [Colletotrichum higginsianum IMI 349063]|uniref:Cellobiose dehydrogenase n=3 Tax=Colletotrichum higginsianum TaxID=80884 RepID=A0A1B7YBL4_COLHI|nr:Cellobiose dehydrogenase [Colletotrichum higginsianum IMI 349063]OBR09491.1 Cellobiose dehydrogenase [Colletotrichum higginsianum IMI 349063]TIC95130.1 Cellobiose dehydrogenase [Colletotrichum higginsianum]